MYRLSDSDWIVTRYQKVTPWWNVGNFVLFGQNKPLENDTSISTCGNNTGQIPPWCKINIQSDIEKRYLCSGFGCR